MYFKYGCSQACLFAYFLLFDNPQLLSHEAPASGPLHSLLSLPGTPFPQSHSLPSGLYSKVTFLVRPSLLFYIQFQHPAQHLMSSLLFYLLVFQLVTI